MKRELILVVVAAALGIVAVAATGTVDLMTQLAEPTSLAAETGRAELQKSVVSSVADPSSSLILFAIAALVSVAAYVLALRKL